MISQIFQNVLRDVEQIILALWMLLKMGGHVKDGNHKLHMCHIKNVAIRTCKLDKSTVIYLFLLAHITQLFIVYKPICWSVCLVIYHILEQKIRPFTKKFLPVKQGCIHGYPSCVLVGMGRKTNRHGQTDIVTYRVA